MRPILNKIKPATGFSSLLHWGLVVALPILVFSMVRINFVQLAVAFVILSKWRMFAVRPRYWPANFRANSIDVIVGIAIIIFMIHAGSMPIQLGWMVGYGLWLILLKPRRSILLISIQAGIGQLAGLMALYLQWSAAPLWGLVLGTGGICYLAARHFLESFEEPYSKLLAYLWGYFGAALVWLLGHWLLFYGVIAQPTLLLLVIGYGLAALYYLDHFGRLTKLLRREFIFIMIAIITVVLVFSHWGNKIV